jgi:excisionase family DNA binding protein
MTTPKVYTFKEAGELLGTSHDTVNRLVRAGRLRVVNISAGDARPRFRVRADDLTKFIEENTHQPPTTTATTTT